MRDYSLLVLSLLAIFPVIGSYAKRIFRIFLAFSKQIASKKQFFLADYSPSNGGYSPPTRGNSPSATHATVMSALQSVCASTLQEIRQPKIFRQFIFNLRRVVIYIQKFRAECRKKSGYKFCTLLAVELL